MMWRNSFLIKTTTTKPLVYGEGKKKLGKSDRIMNNKKYNGWNNYETWAVALWIDNDYNSYQYRCELVERVKEEYEDEDERENCLTSSLKGWIEEQNPIADTSSLFTDLLNSALSKVDWQEIAENFLTE
ncbi:hypothetical protein I4641_15690 [Waterburya agarophytonicola K14]|uniref:Uncharacterized protein n=1 Tax=Waterburya agarophytonicola KI4 TaxID=2874699 RepID=A0A964FG01_9CYAN|nr:hypothetical protein [Waterburya agarophytonicola]MCC0178420.1 hypothetical protein [Waterburya agarophytonicola KI4]